QRFDIEDQGAVWAIDIEGDGFLRHMVRKLVSVLVLAGLGEYDPARAVELLHAGAERGTPKAAPPEGLTLVRIHRSNT
ncbi:MAG: hypothetical protein VX944_09450, partial [Myxococcota bacterium]|nr:hypothetical protein [Myxococcota bacterium]